MKVLRDTLKTQIQPMMTFVMNQTMDDSWMNNHINGIAGNANWPPRRTALFNDYTNSAGAAQPPRQVQPSPVKRRISARSVPLAPRSTPHAATVPSLLSATV